MSKTTTEAFLLLSLSNATITTPATNQSGTLGLECVTVPIPDGYTTSPSAGVDRDVYLVLHLNSYETPIDPSWVINLRKGDSGSRTYTFHGSDANTELVLTVSPPVNTDPHFLEDLDTFEGILAQYADFRGVPNEEAVTSSSAVPVESNSVIGSGFPGGQGDLRGRLVLINEDSGEVVGELDNQFTVKEDPELHTKGHENDPVILEIPEESGRDQDAHAMEMFVRAVPPEDQDWITKSATVVSHAISHTTNLLLTTITSASSYYISHSAPSPHAPSSSTRASSASANPPPPPPRALVFLTSERTRKGLAGVHAVSGQAVKVSSKTVGLIDNMIRKAMGGKAKKDRRTGLSSSSASMLPSGPGLAGSSSHLTPRTPSPSPPAFSATPPAYQGAGNPAVGDKPPLPPRQPSLSPYGATPLPPPLPPRTLSTKDRLLLSADLILSTLDHSARQVLDVGTDRLGAVVGHKYGPEAAQTSLLMAGTARNVGLVYVDMRGIGRRALLKRAGKELVKAQMSSKKN